MLKWDVGLTAGGARALTGLFFVADTAGEVYTGVFVILATVGTFMTLNHTVLRRPDLRIEYRNPKAQNRPVIDGKFNVLVVLVNDGAGPAEAMEVRFDHLKGKVYNETGNAPDPLHFDLAVDPPRFYGRERVLGSHEEMVLCRLVYHGPWPGDLATPLPTEAQWEARARGMKTRKGTIAIGHEFSEEEPS